MTDTQPAVPEWIVTGHTSRLVYLARFTDADGRRHDWHVAFNNFDGSGRRRDMAWYAWPDIPDPDLWDKPVWLHRRIADAQEEFLIRIVHGWRPAFGYADGKADRPIYGRGRERRERRFIAAELSGRGICPHCPKDVHVRVDGTLNAHNRPRSLDRCAGSHERPLAESKTVGQMAKAAGL